MVGFRGGKEPITNPPTMEIIRSRGLIKLSLMRLLSPFSLISCIVSLTLKIGGWDDTGVRVRVRVRGRERGLTARGTEVCFQDANGSSPPANGGSSRPLGRVMGCGFEQGWGLCKAWGWEPPNSKQHPKGGQGERPFGVVWVHDSLPRGPGLELGSATGFGFGTGLRGGRLRARAPLRSQISPRMTETCPIRQVFWSKSRV